MDTEENAAMYLRMADDYDALAKQEEQLARMLRCGLGTATIGPGNPLLPALPHR
jgi:hypothetical protein